ncbi:hypothetical protein CYL31_19845 [Marinomonas sp. A3A]|nr:PD-(D/E)XK nuclease family protein [Marinomonas sp. A3A]QUX93519.1 hypothetical protein CYL31_19845 [Marinomonas sp. A3A]
METELISRMEILLTQFKTMQPSETPETTIFSIGGRGYYENPTTDILAFFCDPNGPHKLGNIVLKALMQCLPEDYQVFDCSLSETPEREVKTDTGKRIDLLLEGPDWVIILENKVYHQQNNPFHDYEKFVLEERSLIRFKDKKAIFVVLSPSGEVLLDSWFAISYPQLTGALKEQLAQKFLSQPIDKWTLILREFIVHLESLMSQSSVNQQTHEFILNNLAEIKEIQDVKQKAINEYHHRLQIVIQNRLTQDIAIRLHHWSGYPAMRFALQKWTETESDVVLYLSGEDGVSSVNTYAHLCGSFDEKKADSYILKGQQVERWVEGKGDYRYRGYRFMLGPMNEEAIVQYIANRILELDDFEKAFQGNAR